MPFIQGPQNGWVRGPHVVGHVERVHMLSGKPTALAASSSAATRASSASRPAIFSSRSKSCWLWFSVSASRRRPQLAARVRFGRREVQHERDRAPVARLGVAVPPELGRRERRAEAVVHERVDRAQALPPRRAGRPAGRARGRGRELEAARVQPRRRRGRGRVVVGRGALDQREGLARARGALAQESRRSRHLVRRERIAEAHPLPTAADASLARRRRRARGTVEHWSPSGGRKKAREFYLGSF